MTANNYSMDNSNSVAGHISSTPDASGRHRLKCPNCQTEFMSYIKRDDKTGELQNIICKKCGHNDAPLIFIYAVAKNVADKFVTDFATNEIRKNLKKSFRNSKNIKFK